MYLSPGNDTLRHCPPYGFSIYWLVVLHENEEIPRRPFGGPELMLAYDELPVQRSSILR